MYVQESGTSLIKASEMQPKHPMAFDQPMHISHNNPTRGSSLFQPLFQVPSVAGVARFHCSQWKQ